MANLLQHETSPYLLQHADNPVAWLPWSQAALQTAVDQDKPIFLSVGYAACHWCHVMAHESFEDPGTAAIMNEHFVNIKVDREERPDIDAIYMDAVVALTGQGGWPMSVFLTPGGEPFYGGTYFPPVPRHNLPSFKEILLHIAREWARNREQLLSTGSQLRQHITAQSAMPPSGADLTPQALDRAAEKLHRTYDWTHGGWGNAPKFPQAGAIEFLLRRYWRHEDKLALAMATHVLDHISQGGLYDQLGGGFHRYSVDAQWLVPHFEKMLYDNALLARVYLHAWLLTQKEAYKSIVHETLEFLIREMRNPEGGFYSSLDADTDGEEGKFFVWDADEFRETLSDAFLDSLASAAYGVSPAGNFEGTNVLHKARTNQDLIEAFSLSKEELAEKLGSARRALFERRNERTRPLADDKVICAWNGLALTAFAEAARYFQDERYLSTAQTLADFLLTHLRVEGGLARSWRLGEARHRAYLVDHATLAEGLLVLYQSDFDSRWYQAAVEQAHQIETHFAAPDGGFFDNRNDDAKLITRPRTIQDSPLPSGNSLTVQLLQHLYSLSGDIRFLERTTAPLQALQDASSRHPGAFSGWLHALDQHLGPSFQLAIIGDPNAGAFQKLAQISREYYIPPLVVAGGTSGSESQPALLQNRPNGQETATAYLCQDFTCNLPTADPEVLRRQLQSLRKSS